MAREINQSDPAQGKQIDRDAVASAYRTHAGALYRYAVMLTTDPAAAEDAIQQVFVKLTAGRNLALAAASEGAYLRRAVRNECYRILNQRRREQAVLNGKAMLAPAGLGPADPQEQAMLEQALRRLPPDQREVIHMKIYEELTFQQIADQLDESINTIAGRYRYGLEKLRQMLPCREDIS